jgi:hypothetical protein
MHLTYRIVLALGIIAAAASDAAAQFPPGSMPDPCQQLAAANRRGVVSATSVAETNRARFMEIVDCAAKDPVMAAQAWPLLRRERDTTVLQMTGMFWRHRDAGVLEAAMKVATDRTATVPAREFALVNAFVIASADTRVPNLRTLRNGASCRTASRPGLGFITGTPLPSDAEQHVRERSKAIADDSSEPARVRSAAACVVARLVPPE